MHVHERVPAVAASVLHMLRPHEPLQKHARVVASQLSAASRVRNYFPGGLCSCPQ